MSSVFLIPVLVLGLASCVLATPKYKISGTVRDAITGVPLVAASVVLSGPVGAAVQTDGAGTYAFQNLIKGTFAVSASKTGYVGQSATVIISKPGNLTQNFSLQPELPPPPPTRIVGSVSDIVGSHISGASVTASGPQVWSVVTDSSGNYSSPDIAPGTYNVTASKSGYASQSKSVTVTTALTTVDFALSVLSTFTGGPLVRYSGNPLLRNGPEDYDYWKAGPRVVLKIAENDYRMWYEANGKDGIVRVALATSVDGLTWNKQGVVMSPSLSWEGKEVSPNSILIEGSVYKMWYHSHESNQWSRIGYATSTDGGMTWTKNATPVLIPSPSGSFDDLYVAEPRVIKLGDVYRMYYTGTNWATMRSSLAMATSNDGILWTKYSSNPVIPAGPWLGWGGAFFYENGMWRLWHVGPNDTLVYKWSNDGIVWNDGPANPVLIKSTVFGDPDSEFLGDSVSGYRDGNTYRIMYTGYSSNLFGYLGRFEGICLATIAAPE